MKHTVSSVKPAITTFLERFFGAHALTDDEDLFATGFVNSMFALQLVQFVEGEFGIRVEDEDLDLDNFRSVAAITAFVERKKGSSAVAG